jgi:hypothetical protein
MAESLVQVTEGSGKKLHTYSKVVGANTVEDEAVVLADQPLASYVIDTTAISIATATDHVLQIMAGASLPVYVRRIRMYQAVAATTAAIAQFAIIRMTTAGTGGTAQTADPFDTTDAAAGAAGMTLPTVKGTESTRLYNVSVGVLQTVPTGGFSTLLLDLDFDKLRLKPIRIPAGTANGIILKNLNAIAAASVYIVAELTEASF